MPDWDWPLEKDVNAFLIHVMSQSGMKKAVNNEKAKVSSGFGNSSEWDETSGLVVTLRASLNSLLRSSQTTPRRRLDQVWGRVPLRKKRDDNRQDGPLGLSELSMCVS
jgi:hypothetical protein